MKLINDIIKLISNKHNADLMTHINCVKIAVILNNPHIMFFNYKKLTNHVIALSPFESTHQDLKDKINFAVFCYNEDTEDLLTQYNSSIHFKISNIKEVENILEVLF